MACKVNDRGNTTQIKFLQLQSLAEIQACHSQNMNGKAILFK